ncbi:MAG: lycopene cyclase domain-containing protein [Candidatus Omnitrophota bacterium]|nr:MAG: lycopene cyclase domain-containing protein [Candidatus Omnitrophota bacterium]
MKEYTFLAAFSVLITLLLDKKSRVGVLKRKEYYIFLFIIFLFKLLVNGYLTGKSIVMYNPRFFLGLRIGSIPLEDFLFGFSMVTMTVIFWEYFKGVQTHTRR